VKTLFSEDILSLTTCSIINMITADILSYERDQQLKHTDNGCR